MAIKKTLQPTKSFISHIMHDEIVIDFADEDRHLLPQIKKEFAENRLDTYVVNVSAGKNYYDMEDLKI